MNINIAFLPHLREWEYNTLIKHGIKSTDDLLNLSDAEMDNWDDSKYLRRIKRARYQLLGNCIHSKFDENSKSAKIDDTTLILGLYPELENYEHYTLSTEIEHCYDNEVSTYHHSFSEEIIQKLQSSNITTLHQLVNLKYSEIEYIFSGDSKIILEFIRCCKSLINYTAVWPNKKLFEVIAEQIKSELLLKIDSKFLDSLYYKQVFKAINETCKRHNINSKVWLYEKLRDDYEEENFLKFAKYCLETEYMKVFFCELVLSYIIDEYKQNDDAPYQRSIKAKVHELVYIMDDDYYNDIIDVLIKKGFIKKVINRFEVLEQ